MSNMPPSNPPFGQPSPGGTPPFGAGTPGPGQPRRPGDDSQPDPVKSKRGKAKKGKDDTEDSGPTRRVLSKQRRIAILFAVGAAALAYLALSSGGPDSYVVRAESTISAQSTLTEQRVDVIAVHEEDLVEGAFAGDTANEAMEVFEEAGALDATATVRIPRGTQITPDMLSLVDRLGGSTEELAADERLVSLNASAVNSVGGRLQAGDRVDVIAALDELAGIIATDVEVVAVNPTQDVFNSLASSQTGEARHDDPASLLPTAPIPGNYTVKVRTYDALRLSVAGESSSLYMVYRADEGASRVAPVTVSLLDTICGLNALPMELEELEELEAAAADVDADGETDGEAAGDAVTDEGAAEGVEDEDEVLPVEVPDSVASDRVPAACVAAATGEASGGSGGGAFLDIDGNGGGFFDFDDDDQAGGVLVGEDQFPDLEDE